MEDNFTRICYQAEFVFAGETMLRELRSDRSNLLQSMRLLGIRSVNWIRVHPMTGMERNTLDEKVCTVVSHVAAVSRIQDEIASDRGFRPDHWETQRIRPDNIYKMLSRRTVEKVIITLDDARSSFDLLSIGFLDRDSRVACKVLLTSRDIIQALKNSDLEMSIIPVTTLPKEEAFLLFNQIVGQTEHTDLVWKIVDMCPGLPLAIEAIAHKLRGQPLFEWELALQTLKRTLTELDRDMSSRIRLSYNYKGWKQYKFMFLLCSILGQHIFCEDLIKYGSSLISGEELGIKAARQEVYTQTGFLKQKNLLLDGKTGEYVSMSKICREVAMAVASCDPDWLIVRKDVRAIEWGEYHIFAKAQYISLQGNKGMLKLPKGLLLGNLKLLHVYNKHGSLKIADKFFMQTNKTELKVLALIRMRLLPLPSSLLDLTNIDTLCLDYCVLEDISKIGELGSLRVLSLSHTNIERLPIQIRQLTRLIMLDLSNCLNLKMIPINVLSKLTKLEYLLMGNSFADWRDGDNYGRDKPSLEELTSLKSLFALDIHILNPDMIPKDLPWGKWDRYNIMIGQDFQRPNEEHKTSRVLKWNHNNSPNDWMESLLKNCDELWLRQFNGFEKVDLPDLKHLKLVKIPEVRHVVMVDTANRMLKLQNLESLEIDDCYELYQIFNFDGLADIHEYNGGLLPKLRQLCLRNLHNFDCFIGDKHLQRRILSFKMLNQLTICNCNQLRYLLPHYVLQNLELLQKIDIRDCSMLEHVFLNKEDTVMIESKKAVLPLLESLKLSNLPKLEHLFSGAPPLIILRLNQVTIEDCPKLIFTLAHSQTTPITNSKEIIIMSSLPLDLNLCTQVKKMWNDHLNFRHMISLQLYRCDNWEYLFSSSVAKSLSSLQELEIISCNILSVIGESKVTTIVDIVEFPRVATLIFEKLPKFSKFCPNNCTVKWLSLKKLRVIECPNIEEFTLGVVDRTLPISVEVIDCSPWENEDFAINVAYLFKYTDEFPTSITIEGSNHLKEYITMPLPLSFIELKTLEATQCDNGLNIFLSTLLRCSRKLERLTVEKCELLEQVFDLGGFSPEGNGGFPSLNTVILSDLPNLNYIWNKNPSGIIYLRRLVKLEIIKCVSLRNLVSIDVVQNLVLLEELYLDSCEKLEEVVTIKVGENSKNQERWFPNLKNLHLLSLQNFIKFNLQNLNFRFSNLLSLTIEHCPKMNIFTTGFLSAQAPDTSDPMKNKIEEAYLQLEALKLVRLKTCEIWQGCVSTQSFCELQELEVDTLSNVKYIFPSASGMLPRFEKLKKLVVSNCNSLTDVFQTFENNSITVAQNLEIIQVKSCDSLRHLKLCPSRKLKAIEISECRKLEEIFMDTGEQIIDAKIISDLEAIILEKLPVLSSFYLGIFEFPPLVKVRITDCPVLQTFKPWSSPNVSATSDNSFMNMESLGKLQELHLINVNSSQNIWNTVLSSGSMRMLKKTYMGESSAVSSENHENSRFEMELLGTLDELVLSDLPNMQLWEHEPQIPVLANLTSLEIIRCNSIQKLFSISVAENLHALKMLKLYGCQNLVQVLQGEGGNSKKVFQELECLILKHLPNLTSFCEQDFEFEFPCLQMVKVEGIPKMETFVKGSLKTPKLKTIYVMFVKKYWQENLNATIKYLKENQDELKAKVDYCCKQLQIAAESSSEKKHSEAMSSSSEDSYSSSSSHGQ